jgi:BolA protein
VGAEGRRARIERALRERLGALHVEVIDESHLHAGHAGAAGGGGHFRALVVSERFAGLSPLAAQRLVYEALATELRGEIHALSLRTLTPERWRAEGGSA